MPYRRLPNTDQSRLRALKTAILQEERQGFNNHVLSFKTLHDARNFLTIFEKSLLHYKMTQESKVNANKKYQQIITNARIYISHFIQVFNLSVIRGEIRKEHKLLYQLDTEIHNVPDLNSEQAILHWGKAIIDGENERIRKGGLPIYNPAIAKVKVHYEVFREYKATQKMHRQTTSRNLDEINQLRMKGDEIIFEIWNQVEQHFRNEDSVRKVELSKQFGLIYYYRKGEKVPKELV